MDAQPRFNELLSAQTTRTCDSHTLHEHLIHDILQRALLACDIERWSLAQNGFGAVTVTVDNCTGERRWAACEGIEIASMQCSTLRRAQGPTSVASTDAIVGGKLGIHMILVVLVVILREFGYGYQAIEGE